MYLVKKKITVQTSVVQGSDILLFLKLKFPICLARSSPFLGKKKFHFLEQRATLIHMDKNKAVNFQINKLNFNLK